MQPDNDIEVTETDLFDILYFKMALLIDIQPLK